MMSGINSADFSHTAYDFIIEKFSSTKGSNAKKRNGALNLSGIGLALLWTDLRHLLLFLWLILTSCR
jgi:hypothetical protein